jgi:hypothetical protein
MYCGVPKPYDIAPIDFFAWRCDDCGHAICIQCESDMQAVGKYEMECCWWNCKGNVQIKVRVKSQFEKPVVPKPYSEFEGEIVGADKWYVEINVNEEWQPIDVLSFQTESEITGVEYENLKKLSTFASVRAEFELPMDDKTYQFLVQGTLVRASVNLGGKLHTMFQGYIYKTPTFTVDPRNITIFHVEAIEGEKRDWAKPSQDLTVKL